LAVCSEWGSWLNAEHTKMEYIGGERCWNGPDRKTIVELTCSDTNTVLSVQVTIPFVMPWSAQSLSHLFAA
jgi:hypothetical protein